VVLHAPGRDCVWGGEISVTYGRLPAGSEKQQEAQVRRASENNHQNYAYVYRADGGFVLAGALVRRTAPADRPAATQVCADELFNWVAV
jgi:hypothetical protein